MGAPQAEESHQQGRADPVAVGITLVLAVVSTLLLALTFFAFTVSQGADTGTPITGFVLLTGLTGCIVGWIAVDSATKARSVATRFLVFVALAADAVTLWLILDRWFPVVT